MEFSIFTDGIRHAGSSFSATICYMSVARDYKSITDTGQWQVTGTTQFPIVNIDSTGQVRVGAGHGPLDVGVVAWRPR